MTTQEAKKLRREYYDNPNPNEEDSFLYTEALDFLIRETGSSDYMVELGAHYYKQRDFDLALKYYEMAAAKDNLYAISNLGYVWYYGRTGEKNYEKAFYYFDRARKLGDLIAAYKVADMYKNGYYVEKDYAKYKEIVEGLYPRVRNARRLDEPLPEVFSRLAGIRSREGKTAEALELYDTAREFLAQRIAVEPFFGDLTVMKWLIRDIYALRPFDPEDADLYDLYHILASPSLVRFRCNGREYEAEAFDDNGETGVRFGDRYFRSADDFFRKAEIEGRPVTAFYLDIVITEIGK